MKQMILLVIFTCLALMDAGHPGGVAMTSNCAQAAGDCIVNNADYATMKACVLQKSPYVCENL